MMAVLPGLDREIHKSYDDSNRSDDFTDGANGFPVHLSISRWKIQRGRIQEGHRIGEGP